MPRTLQQAQNELGGYAQSRYGRAPDWGQLGAAVGYSGQGDIDDDLFGRAQGWIDTTYGAAAPPPPAAAPPPVQMQTGGDDIGYNAPPGVQLQVPGPGGASEFFAPTIPPGGIGMQTGGPGGAAPEDIVRPPDGSVPPIGPGGSGGGGGAVGPPSPTGPGTPGTGGVDLNSLLQQLTGGQPPTTQPNAMLDAARTSILDLIARSGRPVSLSDPNLQPISEQFRTTQQRNAERQRAALAERAGATGTLNTGGFDTQALGYGAQAGFETAKFDAELMREELSTRRQELIRGVELASSMGDSQAARDLQAQLSAVDAMLKQQQLALDTELGRGDLALRGELGRGDLALRGELGRGDLALRDRLGTGDLDLRRLLGLGDLDVRRGGLDLNRQLGLGDLDLRGRSLTQQGQLGRGDLALRLFQSLSGNQQFYDQLGMSAAQWQALMNQNAIQSLFGGF